MGNNIKSFTEYITEAKKSSTFKKLINTEEFFDILLATPAGDTTFDEGGCFILAEALAIYYGEPNNIYGIYNNRLKQIEHFIYKLGPDTYIDAMGIQSTKKLIKNVLEIWHDRIREDLEIIKYEEGMDYDTIPRDRVASQKIADLLREKKSNPNISYDF